MKVQFFATLGQAAELKQIPSGVSVATSSVVESTSKKQGNEYIKVPNWYNVVVWGKNWERFATLPKGTPLHIVWELTIEEYEAKDGSWKRRNAKINVENFIPFSWFFKKWDQNGKQSQYNNVAPQNVAPQNVAPQNVAPQNVAPQNVAPQNVAPQNIAPQNAAPQNAASVWEVVNFDFDETEGF